MFTKQHGGRLLLAGGMILAVCTASAADPFMITSPSFKDGAPLQKKNAGNRKSNPNCVGENVSPPLTWANPPAGTKIYALTMIDPEGRGGLGVMHWIAYGIPVSVTGFAEGEVSKASPKYVGGKGSSHKGGHYQNSKTGDHYRNRQHVFEGIEQFSHGGLAWIVV